MTTSDRPAIVHTTAIDEGEGPVAAKMEKIDSAPGFYRRGGRIYFPYRDDRGTRRWGTARNLTEARAKRAQLIADVTRGEYVGPARETFEQYARAWLTTYQGRTSRGVAPHTLAEYRKRIEKDAIPFFGKKRLAEIRPLDIKEYAATIAARKRKTPTGERPVSPETQ